MATNPFSDLQSETAPENPFSKIATGVIDAGLDVDSGAPYAVREAVSSARKPEDKLAAIQRYYPDASPYKGSNFVFTDQKTGRPTLFNPPGMDIGDTAGGGRLVAEGIGGVIGGTAATILGQLGPQAATPEEAYTVPAGIALGAGLALDMYDRINRWHSGTKDTRGIVEAVGDTGMEAMVNVTGQKAGEIVGDMASNAVARGTRKVRDPAIEVSNAFDALTPPGGTPAKTAGAVSGNRFVQGMEKALMGAPFSANIMSKQHEKMIENLDGFIRHQTQQLSEKGGTFEIGRSIQTGIDEFVGKFKTTSGQLYDNLWSKMPPTTRISADNFTGKLESITGQYDLDPAFKGILESPKVKKLLDAALESDGMSLLTAKSLRTQIGEALSDKNLMGDTSQGQLKQLYGALSKDIESAAQAADDAGADGAYRAFTRANTFYRAGRERIDNILDPMVKGALTDDAYNTIFGQEKGSLKGQGVMKLRALMRSVPERNKKDIAGEFVRRMGRPTSGSAAEEGVGFSPDVFMTNYKSMGPDARQAVFGHIDGLEAAIGNLEKVSRAVKDTNAMANNSGTAKQMMFMAFLSMGGGSPTGMVSSFGSQLVAQRGLAKLFTSPKFINWLAAAGDPTVVNASNPNSMAAHIGRLLTISEVEPWIRDAVTNYTAGLRSVEPAETEGQARQRREEEIPALQPG